MLTCQKFIALGATAVAIIILVLVAVAALLLPAIILTQKPQYGEREEPDSKSSIGTHTAGTISSVQSRK